MSNVNLYNHTQGGLFLHPTWLGNVYSFVCKCSSELTGKLPHPPPLRYLTSFSGPTDALELRGPHNIEQKTAQCQPGRADQILTIRSHSTIRLLMQALN